VRDIMRESGHRDYSKEKAPFGAWDGVGLRFSLGRFVGEAVHAVALGFGGSTTTGRGLALVLRGVVDAAVDEAHDLGIVGEAELVEGLPQLRGANGSHGLHDSRL